MDSLDDKKWFVYLGDHHEGPFTVVEIQAQMAEGHVTTTNYVWCDGMGDWLPMSEVAAFGAAAAPSGGFQQASGGEFAPSSSTFHDSEPSLSVAMPMEGESSPDPFPASAEPVSLSPQSFAEMPAASESEPSLKFDHPVPSNPDIAPMRPVQTGLQAVSGRLPEFPEEARSSSPIQLQVPRETKKERASDESASSAEFETETETEGKGKKILRLLVPVLVLALLAGVVFGFSAGYFDGVLANPAVRAFTGTIGDSARPYTIRLAEKFPALQGIFSPIPRLEDIPDAQYQELRRAAMAGPTSGGVKFGMALSDDAARGSIIYAAANVPDGTRLEVRIFGVDDTLLNQLSFSSAEPLVVNKRFGKTSPFHAADGKLIPRGLYHVYLIEAADDPAGKAAIAAVPAPPAGANAAADPSLKDAKILATTTYFLGGTKDASYDARLKEFHAKLTARAAAELQELHQFSDTLQTQLDETNRRFADAAKGARNGKIAPAKRKAWDAFDQQWAQLSAGLEQSFSKWAAAAAGQEYFYGMLYQMTQQAGESVGLVHKTQTAYLAPTADHRTVDPQLGQVTGLAGSALANLKAKIQQAEKIPPSPNGMPRRDGL